MKILNFKIKNSSRGYSVLELLFYVSFFAVFSLLVIQAMVTMAKSFREASIQSELAQGGVIMERITREIRQAYGINSISASGLKLDTTDANDVNKTVEFLLSGSNVQFLENDVLTGNLNGANIVVTGLTFTEITTVKGKAVKVTLTIRSGNDSLARLQNFYNTIVLRGGY